MTIDCLHQKISGTAEPPKIFRGIIQPSIGCFFGPAKSGKTTLVENLAMNIASGSNTFLGDELKSESRRVLLVSLEEYYRSRTHRNIKQMEALTRKHNLDPSWRDGVLVVDETFPRYILSENHWLLLEKEIERHKPGFVMLDSLSRLTTDSIEDSAVATKLMKKLRDITHKHNIALCLIHHSQKLDDRPVTIASLAGSRIVGQEMDFMIGVNRTSQNIRYIKDVAYRYHPDDSEYVMRFSFDNDHLITELGNVYEDDLFRTRFNTADTPSNEDFVLDEFKNSLGDKESVTMTAKELTNALVNSYVMSKPTLFAALRRLVDNQLISKPKTGTYVYKKPG
jgi:archaellum biogenesis ATPase FlaH